MMEVDVKWPFLLITTLAGWSQFIRVPYVPVDAKLSHFEEVLHSTSLGFVPRKLNPNTSNSNKLPIVLTGTLKLRDWTLQDWTLTDEFAGVDI